MRRYLDDGLEVFRGLLWAVVFNIIIIIVIAGAVWAAVRRGARP